ncbi:hypothetical protein [Actinosynnema sp. NPDC020468]|uniref:hypothetical protein n=1 Tax=Actinosynnema sp. NPDC020468 TaxID=3154488 RepID=UPI0033C451DF
MSLVWFAVAVVAALAGFSLLRVGSPPTPSFAAAGAGAATSELRADPNAGFLHDRGPLFGRRAFFLGTGCPPTPVTGFRELAERRREEPVRVARLGPRTWWWYEDGFHTEAVGYRAQDVSALVRNSRKREKERLERAELLLAVNDTLRRRDESDQG